MYSVVKFKLFCAGIVQFRIRIIFETGDSSSKKKRQATTNNDILENVSYLWIDKPVVTT